MNDSPAPGAEIAAAHDTAQALRREIARVMVGQDEVIDQVLVALFAAGHVLVEGVPGLGKTLLVRALARTFDGRFARIQFTPDLMPSDITGHALYDMKTQTFKIRRGPVFTNLLLADEINRAPAKTQAALLEVMQEQQVTIEGQALPMDRPFMTLATQNPIEQEGTYPLPEAQLDRFLLKVLIDYPGAGEEAELVERVTSGQVGDSLDVSAVSPVVDAETITRLQATCARVQVDRKVLEYAVAIVQKTRNWPGITVGAGPVAGLLHDAHGDAGPRGGIALVRAARAAALLNGHDFVTPDDIKQMAAPALRHRLVLSPEMEIEGQTADTVLAAVLESVEAPRT